jgi:hypothetical protein
MINTLGRDIVTDRFRPNPTFITITPLRPIPAGIHGIFRADVRGRMRAPVRAQATPCGARKCRRNLETDRHVESGILINMMAWLGPLHTAYTTHTGNTDTTQLFFINTLDILT